VFGLSAWNPDAAKIHASQAMMLPIPMKDVMAPTNSSMPAVWKLSTFDFWLSLLKACMKKTDATISTTTLPMIMKMNGKKIVTVVPGEMVRGEKMEIISNTIKTPIPATAMTTP
jgi:hypothetical protein